MSTTPGMSRGHGEPQVLHRRARWLEGSVWFALTALAVVAAAIFTGISVSVYQSTAERARELASERRHTPALVVAADPSTAPGAYGRSRIDVHWTGQDGLPRTGQTTLTGRPRSGDIVEVWVDPDDRLVAPPPGTQDAVIVAVLTWLFGTAVSVAGVAVLGRVLLVWTWWRLGRAWELEWAQVEPEWAGRSGQ